MTRPGRIQLAILEHLAAVAVRQKSEARARHRRFERGWTSLEQLRCALVGHRNRSTLSGLVADQRYVEVRFNQNVHQFEIRISPVGVGALEAHLHREIFA